MRWFGKTTLHVKWSHLGKDSGIPEQQGRLSEAFRSMCVLNRFWVLCLHVWPKDCSKNSAINLALIQQGQARHSAQRIIVGLDTSGEWSNMVLLDNLCVLHALIAICSPLSSAILQYRLQVCSCPSISGGQYIMHRAVTSWAPYKWMNEWMNE